MTLRGLIKMHGMFHSHEDAMEVQHHPFDERVVRSIEQSEAVAATDALEKEGKMSGA